MGTARNRIILACGHTAFVTHVTGDRNIQCLACNEISIVRAIKSINVAYEISLAPQSLDLTPINNDRV